MESNILSQDGLNKGEALIAILLFWFCVWPVVWELASAMLRYLYDLLLVICAKVARSRPWRRNRP
jgi:hypothetical protein